MNVELQKCLTEIIERDLINYKLVNSLEKIGIDATIYQTTSERIIRFFSNIIIPEDKIDIWNEHYFNSLAHIHKIDVEKEPEKIRKLALEILLSTKSYQH